MRLAISTQGPLSTGLTERLLECHPRLKGQGVRILPASTHSGTTNNAYTILAMERVPAAVLQDADTDPQPAYVQRWLVERALCDVAPCCEWRIVLFKPNVEAFLLRQHALLPELLPRAPCHEQLERARSQSRQVLAELFAQAGEGGFPQALLRRLARVDPSPLWATRELRPLEEFLLEKLYPELPEEGEEDTLPAPADLTLPVSLEPVHPVSM
jgi:hypothetical protein